MAGPVCCGLIPHLEPALHPEFYGRPVVVARFGDRVITASEEAAAHSVLERRSSILDGCAMCASFAPTCRCMGAREFITALPKVGGARLTSARLD